jgi:hypothetical protein
MRHVGYVPGVSSPSENLSRTPLPSTKAEKSLQHNEQTPLTIDLFCQYFTSAVENLRGQQNFPERRIVWLRRSNAAGGPRPSAVEKNFPRSANDSTDWNDPPLPVSCCLAPRGYWFERLERSAAMERLERLELSGPHCCLLPIACCLLEVRPLPPLMTWYIYPPGWRLRILVTERF